MRLVSLFAALAFSTVVQGQESILKAEELIRLQDIPLSRPGTFEQQYSPEQLDYLAWLVTRALDKSSAWNPKNRAWALYRANVRYSQELSMRLRWQSSAGTLRSLAQNPDTALPKFYADMLSAQDLEAALEFFRSAAGKAYLAYLREVKRVYYVGMLELDRISVDPDYGAPGDSVAERRKAWLAKKGVSLDTVPKGYSFHVRAMQAQFPWTPGDTLVFALVAGAPPGTESFRRLEGRLSGEERAAIARFLESPGADRERKARAGWNAAIAKSRDAVPFLARDITSLVQTIGQWRALRANPNSLPRSIAQVDPEKVQVPDAYRLIDLADAAHPAQVKECLPAVTEQAIARLTDASGGRDYRKIASMLSGPQWPNMLITRQGFAACVPVTPPGYPVPALNSFLSSVRVLGMSEEEERKWHRAVAQDIASAGASDSLVVMPNGNAFEVSYAVNLQAPVALIYMTRFMLAGAYDRAAYRTVLASPGYRSISTAAVGPPGSRVPRHEKTIVSTPDDIKRDQERRARDTR